MREQHWFWQKLSKTEAAWGSLLIFNQIPWSKLTTESYIFYVPNLVLDLPWLGCIQGEKNTFQKWLAPAFWTEFEHLLLIVADYLKTPIFSPDFRIPLSTSFHKVWKMSVIYTWLNIYWTSCMIPPLGAPVSWPFKGKHNESTWSSTPTHWLSEETSIKLIETCRVFCWVIM